MTPSDRIVVHGRDEARWGNEHACICSWCVTTCTWPRSCAVASNKDITLVLALVSLQTCDFFDFVLRLDLFFILIIRPLIFQIRRQGTMISE